MIRCLTQDENVFDSKVARMAAFSTTRDDVTGFWPLSVRGMGTRQDRSASKRSLQHVQESATNGTRIEL